MSINIITKRHRNIFIVVIFAALIVGVGSLVFANFSSADSMGQSGLLALQWSRYINNEFHYSIQYPQGSELRTNVTSDSSVVQIFIIAPNGLIDEGDNVHINDGMKIEIIVLPHKGGDSAKRMKKIGLEMRTDILSQKEERVAGRQAFKTISANFPGKNFGKAISTLIFGDKYIYSINAFPYGKNQDHYETIFNRILPTFELIQ